MKRKSWFKPTDALIAAFVVPILIMIIIFVQREIFPFGDKSFLRTDLYHQYAPFFSEFKYKLETGGSLLHTWDVGLGTNFAAIYAYYLASPLNWLMFLIPQKYTIEFITYSVVFKIGLCGLTMTYYLNKHNKNCSFATAFFGIFYALSGYVAAYSWNIMWMDCIVLLPLVCLGLERLVDDKKCLLYIITLTMSIMSNFYIAIMVCIFMVIYFIMIMILRGRRSFGDIAAAFVHFAFCSALSGALGAMLLIPVYYALQATVASTINFPKTITQYFSIIDILARHMINVETEQKLDHWPNIYCGIAIFILMVMYFANRKIRLKEKAVYGTAITFMLASFTVNVLVYIWHGLHYPNSLPARQSFIYIFLVLFMGFRTMDEIEGNTVRDIGIATMISLGFVLLCQKVVTDDAFTPLTFYIALAAVALYGLVLYLYKSEKVNINAITFIAFALVAIEAAVNTTCTSITTVTRSAYIDDTADVRTLVSGNDADDTDFYRYDKTKRKTKDDGARQNFRSVSLFSSTAKASLSAFYEDIGCEASVNSYSITGATPLVDALFDIKYALVDGASDDEMKVLKDRSGDTYLYQNPYVLPLGYVMPADVVDNWNIDLSNPADVQNDLCGLLGEADVLRKVEGFHENNDYSVTIPEEGIYYAFSSSSRNNKIEVIDEGGNKTYDNLKRGYFVEIGYQTKNSIVDFVSKDDNPVDMEVYRFNYLALEGVYNKLNVSPMKVNSFDDTNVTAEIDVAEDGILFTSIPYDKGWTVYLDGQMVNVTPLFADSFTGIRINKGHHTLSFKFIPEGLVIGQYLTLLALGILIIFAIISLIITLVNKKRVKKDAEDEEPEDDEQKEQSAETQTTEDSKQISTETQISKSEITSDDIQEQEYLDTDFSDDEIDAMYGDK